MNPRRLSIGVMGTSGGGAAAAGFFSGLGLTITREGRTPFERYPWNDESGIRARGFSNELPQQCDG